MKVAREPKLPPRQILWLAALAALVAASTQLTDVVIRRALFDRLTMTSRDVFWMAPVANLILVTPLAVGLIVFARMAPRRVSHFVAAWLVAFFAAYSTVLLLPLYQIAKVLLSAGVAQRVATSIDASPDRWSARVKRGTIALGVTLGVMAVASVSWRAINQWRAFAALPAAERGAPNILLLVLDTVRAASLDMYGYTRETAPEIRRRGAEGIVFNWAIAPAPWTLPSHASMFTGRLPDELSARFLDPLDDTHPVLAEVLRDRGYATGGFTANYNYTNHESGLDRGFVYYADYRRTLREALLHGTLSRTDSFRSAFYALFVKHSPETAAKAMLKLRFGISSRYPRVHRKDAAFVNEEFLAWQASIGDRPFFAFLNYFDAHQPYAPKPSFHPRFSTGSQPRDRYDTAIASIDEELARLFAELSHRGVLDRTIVIITSDHGEQFGEHQLTGHGSGVYMQSLHVPLVIRYPAMISAGQRVDAAVTLQDLAPTILDLAGVTAPQIGGVSLLPLMKGDESKPRTAVVSELEDHFGFAGATTRESRSLIDESWHYMTGNDRPDQVYRYRIDPAENHNLAETPSGRDAVARLGAELRSRTSPLPYVLRPARTRTRQPVEDAGENSRDGGDDNAPH
jgi:arylsulfatase A-like enzyme